jgi:hypothetical protein
MIRILISICLVLFSITSFSYEMTYLDNNNLRKEFENDSTRKLKDISDWFIAGVDGDVYYRTSGTEEFFHGGGYWFNLRTEIEASEKIVISTRSIFYRGSVSYGYQKAHNAYHLVGVSLKETKLFGNWKLKGRALDLENQTFGAGLLIQDHRIPGVQGHIYNDSFYFKFLKEGTGGLVLSDDLKQLEMGLLSGVIRIGEISWAGDEIYEIDRAPYHYVSSEFNKDGVLGYQAEVGQREDKKAYMLRALSNLSYSSFESQLSIQKRIYEKDFSNEIRLYAEKFYQVYETYDDDFTSPHNIISFANEVEVDAARLKLQYYITDTHIIFGDYEWTKLIEKVTRASKSYKFYKFGYKYRLNDSSNTALTLYASNKVLNGSNDDPLEQRGTSLNSFKEYSMIGANATFSF